MVWGKLGIFSCHWKKYYLSLKILVGPVKLRILALILGLTDSAAVFSQIIY